MKPYVFHVFQLHVTPTLIITWHMLHQPDVIQES